LIESISDGTPESPREQGYRLPAEWEPHEATWIAWPHNRGDWPGKFGSIERVYGEVVKGIAAGGERVRIVVGSDAEECRAKGVLSAAGVDAAAVEFFHFPTNRSWIRDYGPAFVLSTAPPEPRLAISDFGFNGWAKYPDWELDDKIPAAVARALGMRLFTPAGGFVLEGGAIDGNGRGTIVATEDCLLDQSVQPRNPGLERLDVESVLCEYLGAGNVLWLPHGVAGDDTHGHVDDLCRFVAPSTLVVMSEADERDPNFAPLRENVERLGEMRLEDGSKPEVITLPMPEPLYFDGVRLPASYANFYISNASVLVPTFNDPADGLTLGILSELFPDRRVVGIRSVDLVWGLGALHCITREQPALPRA